VSVCVRSVPPRASWKGYLKLSLVSCPIALYPAAERVSFNRINKKTGNRLKQQLVDAETGETVEKEDIGRGYEIGKGQYLQVEDEEIEKIRIESSHTISIDTFVPRTEIDDRYIDDPYYMRPQTKLDRRHSPSSATQSATRRWLLWAVSLYRGASMS
jgi:DNA end-binding protein Ku